MVTVENNKMRYKLSKLWFFIILVIAFTIIIFSYFIQRYFEEPLNPSQILNEEIGISINVHERGRPYKYRNTYGIAGMGKGYFTFGLFLWSISESDFLIEEKMDMLVYVDGIVVDEYTQSDLNSMRNQYRPDDQKLTLGANEKASGFFIYEVNRKYELIEIHFVPYDDNEESIIFRVKRPEQFLAF